jgi:hypothetical protein
MLDAAHVAGAPVDFLSWHDYHDDPAHIEQVAKELVELAEGMNPRPETIIDEWNVKLRGPHANPAFASCHVLETVRRMQKAGLDRACYYQLRDPIFSQEKLRHMLPAREAGKVSRQFERLPMHLGLFDRYGTMRPSFFAFQLLSRLSGFRLNVAAEEPLGVLAAHDPDRVLDVVLAWNASDQIVETELQFTGLAVGATVRWQRLDAQTDSNEELRRLRPQQELRLESPNPKVTFVLAPYEVTYWALIPDSQ